MQDLKQQKLEIENTISHLDKKIKKLPNGIFEPLEFGVFLKKICFYKFWWSMLIICPILFICTLVFNWEGISDSRFGNAVFFGFFAPPITRIVVGAVYGTILLYPLYLLIYSILLTPLSRYRRQLEEDKSYLEKKLQSLHVNDNQSIKKYENHEAVTKSASILADILYNRIQNAFQEFDTKTISRSLKFSVQCDKIIYFSTGSYMDLYNKQAYTEADTVYDFRENHLQNLSDNFLTLTVSAAIAKRLQQIIKQKLQNSAYGKNYTLEIEHSKPHQSFEYFEGLNHYKKARLQSDGVPKGLHCHQFVTVTFSSSNPRYQELKTW